MNLIYALAVVVGVTGVLVAVAAALNPERPSLPDAWRLGLLAVLGFGLAGISASYGGWPPGLAIVAALAGAAILAFFGLRYAPGEPGPGEE